MTTIATWVEKRQNDTDYRESTSLDHYSSQEDEGFSYIHNSCVQVGQDVFSAGRNIV